MSRSPTVRLWRASLLALLVILAGCTALPWAGSPRDDPETDQIGWENGYWHDDPISVTPDDGYNESEREVVVARSMARVEEVRQLEFNRSVPVTVISREEYREQRGDGATDPTFNAWNNQVWEALFLVDEDTDVDDAFDSTLGTSVQGYYAPGDEEIVIVSDSPTPTIDRGTLSHELVHALQDQHFGLGETPDTQDRQLAADSVVEGEANYVQGSYEQRCNREWSCIPEPPSDGDTAAPGGYNRGVLLTIYQPYATGPEFVQQIYREEGWSGVGDLHDGKPVSTEQVIHSETYPDEEPVDVRVSDRSDDEWERFDHEPVADTVGEASINAMFVENGVVSVSGQERFEYESEPSAGWGGDAVVPYTNGTAYGYVWETAWDTTDDAEEFHDAYLDLLDARGAESPRSNVFVIPESDPFDDAFRVTRDGETVRIVNAPTVEQLDGVHECRAASRP